MSSKCKKIVLLLLLAFATWECVAEGCAPELLVRKASKGPFILFTEDKLSDARIKVAVDEDAKIWWEDFRRHVEADCLARAIEIPSRGAQWYHYYCCRKCGVHLKPKSPTEHGCPNCGEVYLGWPYDDAYLFERHHWAANAARDCAIAYAISRDRKFGERARDYLIGYAKVYEGYELHNNDIRGVRADAEKNGARNLARAFSQPLDESIWLIRLLQAYDCIVDLLTVDERAELRTHLFRPALEVVHAENFGIHNHECWHLSAYGLAGLVLGDEKLVNEAINGRFGMLQQLEKGILSDGCWYEGAWGYHFYVMRALVPFVEALTNLGLSPPLGFKRMFDAPFGQVTPNWKLPAVNDCARMAFQRGAQSELYEFAWRWWHDPRYAWWLSEASSRRTLSYVLSGAEIPKGVDNIQPKFGSVDFSGSGLLVLRSSTPGSCALIPDNYVALDYGPYGNGHEHPDKLNMIFYGHGEMIAEDPGCIDYGNMRHWNWYRSSLAHNELVMDGTNQVYTTGRLVFFDDTENKSCALLDAGEAYPGARVRRAVALVNDVLMDLIWSESDAVHEWEWAFHSRGKVEASVPTESISLPEPDDGVRYGFGREANGKNAWNWTQDVREGEFAGGWSATWRKDEGRVTLGLAQVVREVDSGRELTGRIRTAVGSAQPSSETFDLIVPRVKGRNVAFASVMTPGRASSAVQINELSFDANGNALFSCAVNGVEYQLQVTSDGKVVCRKVGRARPAPNYWCTWSTQRLTLGEHAKQEGIKFVGDQGCANQRANLNERVLFGANGWARTFWPKSRGDLYLLIDDGWDVPSSANPANGGIAQFGSCVPDQNRFASFAGTPTERLRKVNEAAKSCGWRGIGIWVSCQTPGERSLKSGECLSVADSRKAWANRMKISKDAGVEYWKVDWGVHGGDPMYRIMMCQVRDAVYPMLQIEHSSYMRPMNGISISSEGEIFGSGLLSDDAGYMSRQVEIRDLLAVSDVLRTYDYLDPLACATTLERCCVYSRIADKYRLPVLLNVEGMVLIGAALGHAFGIMRMPGDTAFVTDEDIAVSWQKIAPPFGHDTDSVMCCSVETLAEEWKFEPGSTWCLDVIGKRVHQRAPAILVRGLPLPEVRAEGEKPFVCGARFPNGAVAVACLPRHGVGKADVSSPVQLVLDIELKKGVDFAVFGRFDVLVFKRGLASSCRVSATNLANGQVKDITNECLHGQDGSLSVPFSAVPVPDGPYSPHAILRAEE